jgi:hypothetical protein
MPGLRPLRGNARKRAYNHHYYPQPIGTKTEYNGLPQPSKFSPTQLVFEYKATQA